MKCTWQSRHFDLQLTFEMICLSSLAFHILKDTTVKFTLEKVHVAEDAQFPFHTTGDPFNSTDLLKVEGRVVNPVQVFMPSF